MSRSPPKPSSSSVSLCIFFKISIFLSFSVQLSRPVINFGLHIYIWLCFLSIATRFLQQKLQSLPPPAINQKHHDDRHHEGNWRPGMSRPTSRSRGWWCIKLQLGNAGMATIDLPVSSHASSTSATLAVTLMTRLQSHCSHLKAAPANNRPLLFLVSSPVHLLLFLQISQRL